MQIPQNLFPGPRVPVASRGYSLSKGKHSYPFEIRFPVLSACPESLPGIHHVTTSLPPSFQLQGPNQSGNVNVHYWLELQVRRPGALHRDGLLEQKITFIPLDPALPPPMLSPSVCKRQGAHVALEATLPSPSVLFLGSVVPLRLFVRRPRLTGDVTAIFLRTLAISVRTETTVTAGAHATTWRSTRDITSVTGLELPIGETGEEPMEIPSEMWSGAAVSDLTPSFTTCTIRHQHALAVSVGFDCGDTGAIEVRRRQIECC